MSRRIIALLVLLSAVLSVPLWFRWGETLLEQRPYLSDSTPEQEYVQQLIDDDEALDYLVRSQWYYLSPAEEQLVCELVADDVAGAIDSFIRGMHNVHPGLRVDRAVVGRALLRACR